jgi:glycosyltransferase involved in cell wall biosynthesis
MSRDEPQPRSVCFVGIENLLVLAPEYRRHGIGGAQLQQVLLARSLARRGFNVSTVVADHGQADGAQWHGVTTRKAYRFDAGLPGIRFIYPRAGKVWSAMKRANAEIYYCSCADYLPGVLSLFARIHRRKTVFRIAHDTDCRPDELMIPNLHSKVMYRYGLPKMDLILAQTASQQAEMLKNFHRPSLVIPSLVELTGENRAFEERTIDVLWVSNIRPFKRPEMLLELAASLPAFRFHMVGGTQPGALEYFGQIRERAASVPNVAFHGPLSYDEVERMMAQARLFVNTSESEGFPNTYLQAWARGTPVVGCFDPDGIVQRASLGHSAQTVGHMRDAVQELLGSRDAWSAASARCRQHVTHTHGEKAIDAYAEALDNLRCESRPDLAWS